MVVFPIRVVIFNEEEIASQVAKESSGTKYKRSTNIAESVKQERWECG